MAGREVKQYFIVAEINLYYEVNSLAKAFSALFAIYYVYDIACPKQCSNSCLFVEGFLFALKGPRQLTQTAIGTIASIEHFKYSESLICTSLLLLFVNLIVADFFHLLLHSLKVFQSKSCVQVQNVQSYNSTQWFRFSTA